MRRPSASGRLQRLSKSVESWLTCLLELRLSIRPKGQMLSQSETRLLHALKSRAGRDKHGAFMVEGVRALEDLVAAGIDLKFAVVSPTFEDSTRGRALTEVLEVRTTVRRLKDHELRELAETETPQ